ncbi:MAG TPA: hypothetical protein VMY42_18020 [Thermoguttaceae bacterium]|nr:hypothetical protein [Thermoguttaceae bacterium]
MAFRLARELGIVDVDGMMNSIPERLFREWNKYLEMEPPAWQVNELMLAQLAGIYVGAHSKKRHKLSEFMLISGGAKSHKKLTDPESQQKFAKAMTAALGGTIRKKGEPSAL